jgi:hypothetical protein
VLLGESDERALGRGLEDILPRHPIAHLQDLRDLQRRQLRDARHQALSADQEYLQPSLRIPKKFVPSEAPWLFFIYRPKPPRYKRHSRCNRAMKRRSSKKPKELPLLGKARRRSVYALARDRGDDRLRW